MFIDLGSLPGWPPRRKAAAGGRWAPPENVHTADWRDMVMLADLGLASDRNAADVIFLLILEL